MSRTAVYRFFDSNHELLYVGITAHIGRRFKEHEAKQMWWEMTTSIDVTWFPTPVLARAVELETIRSEWPIFNNAGHPDQDFATRTHLYGVSMGFWE